MLRRIYGFKLGCQREEKDLKRYNKAEPREHWEMVGGKESGMEPGVSVSAVVCVCVCAFSLCMPSASSGGRSFVFVSEQLFNPLIVLNYLMALIRALDTMEKGPSW